MMKPYRNSAGNSGVVSYDMGPDYIKIRFMHNDRIYVYSYNKAGKKHVEEMKRLAEQGRGLSTYISRYVKDLYD